MEAKIVSVVEQPRSDSYRHRYRLTVECDDLQLIYYYYIESGHIRIRSDVYDLGDLIPSFQAAEEHPSWLRADHLALAIPFILDHAKAEKMCVRTN